MNLINRLMFKVTARRWNTLIASTLSQAYQAGVINSRQLHTLAHEFDPSQSGRVGRIVYNGANIEYADVTLDERWRAHGRSVS